MGRSLARLLFGVVLFLLSVQSAIAADPTGILMTPKDHPRGWAKVQVYKCGNFMCAKVVQLQFPINPETGGPWKDVVNQNMSLRDRPLMGTELFIQMEQNRNTSDEWFGQVYNARDDGGVYTGRLKILDADRLHLRGWFLVWSREEIWTRSSLN